MVGVQPVKENRSRHHIVMTDATSVRRWTRHLKVTKDQLQCAVDKVGTSVVAVRKQMGIVK
jgi:hypothetical protein